jgi:hypothetical protein
MPTRLESHIGKLDLPFVIELGKAIILQALQDQVTTPIDPESLAYDQEGFMWDEGDIVLDVTFKDRKGFGQGRVFIQPTVDADLDVCIMADVKFKGYLPSAGSS